MNNWILNFRKIADAEALNRKFDLHGKLNQKFIDETYSIIVNGYQNRHNYEELLLAADEEKMLLEEAMNLGYAEYGIATGDGFRIWNVRKHALIPPPKYRRKPGDADPYGWIQYFKINTFDAIVDKLNDLS